MEDYLVNLKTDVGIPNYRSESPTMNLNALVYGDQVQLDNVNILQQWPHFQEKGEPLKDSTHVSTELDTSQIDALKRILTKRLAIVQGPPGTGKTFTSVTAIKVLLDNMTPEDPPIIITAQTNHAVDQILRHIAKFEPNFIRLGGQTTDLETIKPRTLYELKASRRLNQNGNSKAASHIRNAIASQLDKLLRPLSSIEPITADIFHDAGLLTNAQRESINNIESPWAAEQDASKMNLWCEGGLSKIVNADKMNLYAEVEVEDEILDEGELEIPDNDSDRFERLHGPTFELASGFKFSGRSSGTSDKKVARLLLKHQDLLKIPLFDRPAVYEYLRCELVKKINDTVRSLGQRCNEAARLAKIGKWETEYEFVNKTRVIGLTTTGLSKYRGLLDSLNPKIVLIEEAAETLEPYTIAAIFESLEHLILVGDHQQLRANCCCSDLADESISFDVSLFERLVKNHVEFTRLTTQRRMRPGIRELIGHIYPDLTDHPSVIDRPDISGMDGSNLHFFHHENMETMDETRSKKNEFEARMIVEFTKYLVWNDVCLDNITVLTFYNGQRRLILELFKGHETFDKYRVKVCTVDSYQGEENDVVLLSLVRNNESGSIGFLENVNRVCVALSRARLGMYVFGNAKLLIQDPDWATVIDHFQHKEAIRSFLPLYCPVHDTEIDAKEYSDLQELNGGCYVDCAGILSCGHKCPLKCHPARACLAEDCEEVCQKTLACGHECIAGCGNPCRCGKCSVSSNVQRYSWIEAAGGVPPSVVQTQEASRFPTNDQRLERKPQKLQAPSWLIKTPDQAVTSNAAKKWTEFASTTSKTYNLSNKETSSTAFPGLGSGAPGNVTPSKTNKAGIKNDTGLLIDLTESVSLEEQGQATRSTNYSKHTGHKSSANKKQESLI